MIILLVISIILEDAAVMQLIHAPHILILLEETRKLGVGRVISQLLEGPSSFLGLCLSPAAVGS
jgi:hypothetical protein